MLEVYLPRKLEIEYYSINREFQKIEDDWKNYNDEIIPEDKEFCKRIANFIISVIDFIKENYEKIEIKDYQKFLGYYDILFFYGPNGDDRNYLDLDETIDSKSASQFCWELKNEDFNLTREKLKEIRYKYSRLLSLL